ncbi:hypothetical protein DPMN_134799 [Dreissena polymorpha]|uniref:Retrotransposon gag domain-containing protein n=1 Tax=Dreissena polymorpha TaxID=45954 RepID=A0A9D4JE43_DREPO|nr:hypothetical protein DPMN_134799 [Dreissena polymorpha]
MLDQLLHRLEGLEAQFAFSQLFPNMLNDYQSLVEELDSRFRIIETQRSFASKFSQRSQRHGETLKGYSAEFMQLYDNAYDWRDRRNRDEDLVRRFLDGLSENDVKFEVEFNKEPRNIDEAVYFAVNLMPIWGANRAERRNHYNARRTEHEDNVDSVKDDEENAFTIKGANVKSKLTTSCKRHEAKIRSEAATVKELQERIEKLEAE